MSGTYYVPSYKKDYFFLGAAFFAAFLGAAFFATAFFGAAAFLGAAFFAVAMFLEFNS